MSTHAEEAVQEAVVLDGTVPDSQRQCAQRAKSITTALPLPQTPDVSPRVAAARERLAVLGAQLAARAVSISAVAMRPPSIQENHAAHREAAAQWEAALIRWPRHAWGFGHTCAKATADWLLAITFSPVGAVLAVAFIIVCWFWL